MEGHRSGMVFGTGPDARTEQLVLLIDSVTEYAIFLLDPEGHIATWNPGAQRIKGYSAEEIIGQHFSVFYTEADRERRHPDHELEIAIREGRYEEESWRVRKDGSVFWANVVITAVRDRDGTLLGFGKVTRDLTARRAAEESLRAAQGDLQRSNEELRRFASVAAHDLNEPLRTIAGMADLLVRRHLDLLPEDGREFLFHISSSAERMGRLIDSLLDYTRAGHAPRASEPVALRDAVQRVVDDLSASIVDRGAEVDVDVEATACVSADDSDLQLVVQNLLSNALKFGDPQEPRVRVSGEHTGSHWRLVVADNGIGIPPDEQPRVFEAFHRAHPDRELRGTGLGLAICERIVHRHRGRIGVDSHPGAGSRFWFELPAAAPAD